MATFPSRSVAVLSAAVLCAGCGASRDCTLAGKVTYQGKPVVYGTVTVQCADGTRLASNIQPDGSYTVERLLAGPVKIGVSSPAPPDAETRAAVAAIAAERRPAGPPANLPAIDRSRWFALPDELSDPETSGKTTTVSSGTNPFDILLP